MAGRNLLCSLFLYVVVVNEAGNFPVALPGELKGLPVEHHQGNHHFMVIQKAPDGIQGDLQSLVLGKTVVPGGNQGKRNGFTATFQSQRKGGFITAAQKFPFSQQPTPPNRANGVDDILCVQTKSRG